MIRLYAAARASLLCIAFAAPSLPCPGQSYYVGDLVHAVSLAQFENEADASRALPEFWTDHPTARVMACGDGNGCHVVIGAFSTHAEAWAIGAKLLGKSDIGIVSDVRSVALSTDFEPVPLPRLFGETEGLRNVEADLPPVFENPLVDLNERKDAALDADLVAGLTAPNLEAIEALTRYLEKAGKDPHADTARVMLGRRLMRVGQYDEAESVLSLVAGGDRAGKRAEAELVLAYVKDSRGDRAAAFEAFRAVASNGDASPQIQLDAMRRAAGIAHARYRYPDAWLAFSELEAAAPNDAIRAEARLQLAGIALELAGRAKGKWYEVLPLCEAVIELPNAPREIRATAELIHLESMYLLGMKDGALAEADAFIERYPDIVREHTSARVWKGVILTSLHRGSEAAPVLESILREDLTSEHKFGGHEPKAMAALWLARVETTRGDREKRDEYLNLIVREYPETREAREAMQILGIRPVEN